MVDGGGYIRTVIGDNYHYYIQVTWHLSRPYLRLLRHLPSSLLIDNTAPPWLPVTEQEFAPS